MPLPHFRTCFLIPQARWIMQELMKRLLQGLYWMAKVFGLLAATSTPTKQTATTTTTTSSTKRCGKGKRGQPSGRMEWKLHYSRYWRLHGYLVMIFVGCYSPYAFWTIFCRMSFLRQNRLLLIIGFNRYVLVLFCAFFTLYIHTSKQKNMLKCFNGLLKIQRELKRLTMPASENCRTTSASYLHTWNHSIALGVFLICFVCSSSHTTQLLLIDPEVRRNIAYAFSLFFVFLCQLCLELSLGMYFLALLLITHLVHQCNMLLKRLLSDVNDIHRRHTQTLHRRTFYSVQQYWLSLELWQLLRVHFDLMRLSRCISSLHSVQMLCFIAFVPMECMVHLFISYFVHYSRAFLRRFHRRLPLNMYAMVFIGSLFINLSLVILYTHRMRRKFAETRNTLSRGGLALPSGNWMTKQLRETIQYWGLYLKQGKRIFRITACGLFKLNNAILFCIVQGMLIYMMILIQFDKVINK
ncbi:LOW QUALITY PROTEIN: putative gustatory receptor 77a [Drosophila tropicalis]|uniref:LOW QUALITY PROTEIN: putative gustatory receptor 77a n=1 Tax=Drosophila tropicalis TaxID=46794 RepID=UPI0035ABEA1A